MNTNYDITYYINDIRQKLAAVYNDDTLCQQYAWWILQAICGKTKTELIIQEAPMLTPEQQQKIDRWMQLLVQDKMPLQYVLGSVPFADLDILVEPPTLIPRPETEEWCLYIVEHLLTLDNKKITILDVATGSGCIALAFADYLPQARIVATDIADAALELTEKNIEHNKIRNVTCIQSDLFESIPCGMRFDCIVSNPPYITAAEFKDLDETVTRWEDHDALIAHDNGLAIIKEIIAQAPQFIHTNDEMKHKNIPQVVIEIGYAQGVAVRELMHAARYNDILVHKDLEGKDRFVTGRVDYVANSSSGS
ncbi:MAG TPA: peptide chain release factor N(5)-glutamine methyltransferase [Candidatus Babeliales bacterium]|nr:peptide chain release factor N(5)-glutamine methyltransferase [Candidatus Babeliales bacterium]